MLTPHMYCLLPRGCHPLLWWGTLHRRMHAHPVCRLALLPPGHHVLTLYACLRCSPQVTTRYFGYNNSSYMIPIIDMANHDNRCPHWHQLTVCHEGSDKQCFVWAAGRALEEGEEVCNTYGVLRNDEALLQYGFVLPDSPPQLAAIDYHDYRWAAGQKLARHGTVWHGTEGSLRHACCHVLVTYATVTGDAQVQLLLNLSCPSASLPLAPDCHCLPLPLPATANQPVVPLPITAPCPCLPAAPM
jgi:hypothetical protein